MTKAVTEKDLQMAREHEQMVREARFPCIAKLLHAQWFEWCIAALILTNCATMGLEADCSIGVVPEYWLDVIVICEHAFTALYLIELIMRVMIFGYKCFIPVWGGEGSVFNFIDAMLVLVTGVLINWILPVFQVSGDSVKILTVLRAMRLVRLIRVVRKVELFHEVYLLLRGLTESMRTLFWTVVVIFFITYVFAVFGVVLITPEIQLEYHDIDVEEGSEEEALLLSTEGIMPFSFTLIQVLTLDSWTGLARPIQVIIPWSWVFWFLYIAVATIVLMNLVTAIIVDNALQNSKKDEEDLMFQKQKEREQQFQEFKLLFEMMDTNENGQLSWDEFEVAFDEPKVATKLKNLDFQREQCREIFHLLDSGDGNLSLEEFFEGLQKMKGDAPAKDVFKVMKYAEATIHILNQMGQEISEDVGQIMSLTPGTVRLYRDGNLKSRSTVARQKEKERQEAAGETARASIFEFGSQVDDGSMEESTYVVTKGLTLQDIADRISTIDRRIDHFHSQFDECQSAVSGCNKKIEALSIEVSGLKAMTQDQEKALNQQLHSIRSQPQEVPCCTGMGQRNAPATLPT